MKTVTDLLACDERIPAVVGGVSYSNTVIITTHVIGSIDGSGKVWLNVYTAVGNCLHCSWTCHVMVNCTHTYMYTILKSAKVCVKNVKYS